jgi:hypothetical protein
MGATPPNPRSGLPASGTLLLLGGRRAILHDDGSVETEKAAAPEALAELVEVPAKGTMVLVGRGAHGVYRFDDPLGAPAILARSNDPLARLGAGPSFVAVWRSAGDLPRFLDVATGAEASFAGLPTPPLHALAFADATRGAGVFEGVGLAVTADGGASWRLVTDAGSDDALRSRGLRLRHAGHDGGHPQTPGPPGSRELRAFTYHDAPDGPVDVEGARLGRPEAPSSRGAEPALVRWIRGTGRDPLEAVASGGVESSSGRALVASHGLVARVDPKTGAVDAIVDLARGNGIGPCSAGRAGQAAWVACTLAVDGRDFFDPFGVVSIPLAEGPLAPPAPVLVRNGETELRVSPSGGAMLLGPCSNEDMGSACVRQPDGKWKTIAIEGDLSERGAGPLADGRIAFLRGMFDGDEVPSSSAAALPKGAPAPPPAAPPSAAPPSDDDASKRLHVALIGVDGKEHALPPFAFTMTRGYARAQSPIEEDEGHTLRFVVEDGAGPFVVTVPQGKEAGSAERIPGAIAARLHAGRGIAVGERRILASLDAGASWNEVAASEEVLRAAQQAAGSYEEPGELGVSEVGAKMGPVLRVGWGPSEASAAEGTPVESPGVSLSWPRPAHGTDQILACTSQGTVGSAAPVNRSAEVRQLLEGGASRKTPGVRRESVVWSGGRMLDTVAVFEEEGPEAHGHPGAPRSYAGIAPTKWTIRWQDPQEIGSKVRSASIPVPKDAAWGTSVRFAAASGARGLFALRSAGKLHLVRTKPSGGADVTEIASDLLPVGEAVFGDGRSQAIAWARETQVYAWLVGERPRAIARFAAHGSKSLGAPTAEGVPILLGSSDTALQRIVKIPPLEKDGAAPPPPARLALEGWTRLAPLSSPHKLPACTAKATGSRYSIGGAWFDAEIDGDSESAGQTVYEVRVQGGEACLAGVTAMLAPKRGGRSAAPPPKGKAPSASPAAFVRVDLVGKRAEGGDRGPPPAAVRRMTCTLVEARRP